MATSRRQSAVKSRARKRGLPDGVVAFSYRDALYHIDFGRQKVYRSWVEVDRKSQLAIISAFRATGSAPAL